jgi:hypothetical protein
MEILLMLLEDTEKNIVTGECQIVILCFLLTADFERWKYSKEYDGMLVVHIVHVIYGQTWPNNFHYRLHRPKYNNLQGIWHV